MTKKKTEIAKNTSSGAEKVARIEREIREDGERSAKTVVERVQEPKSRSTQKKTSAKGASALGGGKAEKSAEKAPVMGKAEKESENAKKRVAAALKRKEEQHKRKEERRARMAKKAEERKKRAEAKKQEIAKRNEERKARAEKRKEERKALAEKRKAEKEEKIRRRAHAKANRNDKNYQRKKQKSKQKSERKQKNTHRDGREKGYGGWIAAVVSLGVVSLALATTVTVGGVEMAKNNRETMGAYRATTYELTGIMENVEKDLDRVRISNSPAQQSRILTDLLVQTRLAELDLEKLPMRAETDRNVTSFINRTAHECERLLSKLRAGEELTSEDRNSLEKLYEINRSVCEELNGMANSMTDKDISSFMKKGEGMVKDAVERIEKSTILENVEGFGKDKTTGAGMRPMENMPAEKEEGRHIEAATAEQLCLQYFAGYSIGEFQCIGETVGRGYEAYNVQGYDDRGNQLFAELSQADGTLLRFNYYEDCSAETLDIDDAEEVAEEFLEGLGYDDMEVVRLRRNGSTVDFTFVYEDEDVVYYADEILVKVCRSRGVVSGYDATKYVQNHKARTEPKVKVTLAEAYSKLREGLEVASSRLAVIRTPKGERTAYEFLCSYGEERYFIFLDAMTGEEISIVNVKTVS